MKTECNGCNGCFIHTKNDGSSNKDENYTGVVLCVNCRYSWVQGTLAICENRELSEKAHEDHYVNDLPGCPYWVSKKDAYKPLTLWGLVKKWLMSE